MTFDPAALIPLGEAIARIGLPFLPSILKDVVPFPLSLLTGGAVREISLALGVDPAAPDAPAQAAARIDADPATARLALQPVEDQHAALAATAEDEVEARLRDVADARATEVSYIKSGSPMEWAPAIVSAITVAGFFVICAIMLFHIGDQSIAQGILGALTAGWTTVLTYWCGSSKGSSDKTAALTALASQPQVIQGPGSHVSGGVAPTRRR